MLKPIIIIIIIAVLADDGVSHLQVTSDPTFLDAHLNVRMRGIRALQIQKKPNLKVVPFWRLQIHFEQSHVCDSRKGYLFAIPIVLYSLWLLFSVIIVNRQHHHHRHPHNHTHTLTHTLTHNRVRYSAHDGIPESMLSTTALTFLSNLLACSNHLAIVHTTSKAK